MPGCPRVRRHAGCTDAHPARRRCLALTRRIVRLSLASRSTVSLRRYGGDHPESPTPPPTPLQALRPPHAVRFPPLAAPPTPPRPAPLPAALRLYGAGRRTSSRACAVGSLVGGALRGGHLLRGAPSSPPACSARASPGLPLHCPQGLPRLAVAPNEDVPCAAPPRTSPPRIAVRPSSPVLGRLDALREGFQAHPCRTPE